MKTESLKCEIVTPMFLGGADNTTAELRAPSIKGVLRFWWRALYGNIPEDELLKREGEIFGGANKIQCRSQVVLRVAGQRVISTRDPFPNHPIQVKSKGRTFPINILEYLAYGTLDYVREQRRNIFNRDYLQPGSFELRLSYPEELEAEVNNALFLFANFGGLGSRSRNGLGSVYIDDPRFNVDIVERLKELNRTDSAPSFSALSSGMRLFVTKDRYNTWDNALAELGKCYRACRGELEPKHEFNKRVYIASPLIADKKTHSRLERHAKPYFMSVQKVEGKYQGRILYLPSKYCDGLERDLQKRAKEDATFASICAEFNSHLAKRLEVVL